MAGCGIRLSDVQKAVVNGDNVLFERVPVHIVGFEAPYAWPSKFTYCACNMPLPDGRHCLKSVERRTSCSDGHLWREHRPVFRFQVKLADGSLHGWSVKATVFSSTYIVLGRSASDFRDLPFAMHDRIITEAFHEEPKVIATLRVIDGKVVVEHLLDSHAATTAPAVEVEQQTSALRQFLDKVLIKNARNVHKFEAHMKEHGFRGIDHACNDRAVAEFKNSSGRLRTRRQNCSPDRINERANKLQLQWLRESKTSVLRRLRSNLLRKFTNQFGMSEAEAITQARLDAFVYKSDGESLVVPDSVDQSGGTENPQLLETGTPGDSTVQLSNSHDPKNNCILPTPEKWIVTAYSSDEEPFQ
ncbi:hypothetical protein R1sor_020144 [Riccia sorocarpa]|uniref:Uncharacterized protein n=1 Tax=Riccia sorocarpa TaxID=122646 RepID=A0ABD3IEN8_9MARC